MEYDVAPSKVPRGLSHRKIQSSRHVITITESRRVSLQIYACLFSAD